MKLIKTASGKQLKISKEEWRSIGKKAGWREDYPSLDQDAPEDFEYDPYINELEDLITEVELEDHAPKRKAWNSGIHAALKDKKEGQKRGTKNPYNENSESFNLWERSYDIIWNPPPPKSRPRKGPRKGPRINT